MARTDRPGIPISTATELVPAKPARPARDADDASANLTGWHKAVVDARRLLEYAVRHGLVTDVSIIQGITEIENQLSPGTIPDQNLIENFLKSYNNLMKLTDGVSADSLSLEAEKDQRWTRSFYVCHLRILLLLLVPITMINFVGSQLIQDSLRDINWVCDNEPSFCINQEFNSSVNPKISHQDTKYNYDIGARAYKIWRRNTLMSWTVDEKMPDWPHDDSLLQKFYIARYKADIIATTFNLIYGTIAGYLLTIAFAMLGAVIFGLREVRQRIEAHTWIRQGRAMPRLRLVTAASAGYMISIFSDFAAKSGLPPIVFAFMIGYSIDIFFAFVDSVVARLKAVAAPLKTGEPQPGRA